nr:MAG TPA: hypothetical protein [Caudoviricetes sp.]
MIPSGVELGLRARTAPGKPAPSSDRVTGRTDT